MDVIKEYQPIKTTDFITQPDLDFMPSTENYHRATSFFSHNLS